MLDYILYFLLYALTAVYAIGFVASLVVEGKIYLAPVCFILFVCSEYLRVKVEDELDSKEEGC